MHSSRRILVLALVSIVALLAAMSAMADQTERHSELAGPGLRSMTRMASSPFHIWRDIFETSGYLPHELRTFIQRLQTVLDSLERGDSDGLEKLFKRGGST